MVRTVLDAESLAWSGVLEACNADLDRTLVVTGYGAPQIAQAILHLGGPPPVATTDTMVVASRDQIPDVDDLELTPVKPRSADVVIVAHAWSGPADLGPVTFRAASWTRPGGVVILADLDVGRLVTAQPYIYPSAALYRTHPEIAEYLTLRSVNQPQLAMAAVRAGLRNAVTMQFERPVGVFNDPESHRAGVAYGAWRGIEMLDDPAAIIGSLINHRNVTEWPYVECEPWVAIAGMANL